MKLSPVDILALAAGAAGAAALPSFAASALDYPTRPVRLIEGFGGGGTPDLVARLIGQWLADHLGQPFVVENRTGAGGNVATAAVVAAAPDGYTLLACHTANAINASLYEKLDFNFIRDIAPVAGLVRFPMVLLVNPSFPAATLAEFIAYAKANPGKINMASPGIGTPMHVAIELLKMQSGRRHRSRALSRPGGGIHRSLGRTNSSRSSSPSRRRSASSNPARFCPWR